MSESTQLEDLFHAARALKTPAEQAAFLAEACGDSPELRCELERLLAADAQAGTFLDRPPAELNPTIDHSPNRSSAENDRQASDLVGTSIGPYKLLEAIGEGGMGVVYMAEQQAPLRRLVALKLIKPGLDTHQVIARFEAERQALAMMDHPNIARVVDAGATDSGRPFFVMELVRGVPITEYCDANQLTVSARLELFGQVCHAVQHAHQKGIIHRDIKPSNVLVTLHDGVPVPKVIDFGVAKATNQQLTEKTLVTFFAQMIGTPLYMSPEQAEMSGLDVDTRSDVYSLGVLLYELLTGTTPFDRETLRKAAYDEVRRIIREDEPPRPSARISTLGQTRTIVATQRQLSPVRLSQLIRGELDWIVMKSLEKDRKRRYETASAFAADIAHYLADQPVDAGPPSNFYRVRKFARRNRSLLTTAAGLMGILILATLVSSWQAIRATQAERRAEDQAAIAKANELAAEDERRRADDKAHEAELRAREANAERTRADEKAAELFSEKEAVRQHAYAWQMNLARVFWEDDRLDQAHQLLEAQVPSDGERDLRGWEWYYQRRLCESELRTLRGHTDGVNSIAFRPDGHRLASSSDDETIKIWDANTGAELLTLRGHTDDVNCVTFSSDGMHLASGSDDKMVKVWDANTGAELHTLRGLTDDVYSVTFSPDGQRLASADNDTIKIWDANTGTESLTIPEGAWWRKSVAFSPDGQRLASASPNKTAKVWDANTGAELLTLRGHDDDVDIVAFSPDGRYLACSSGSDGTEGTVKVWDSITGVELHTLRGLTAHDVGWCIAFSPDGRHLACSDLSEIKVWHTKSGEHLRTLERQYFINGIAYSPDGGVIASAGSDDTVKLWSSQDSNTIRTLTRRRRSRPGIEIGPDGGLITCSAETIEFWDADSGVRLKTLDGHVGDVWSVALNADKCTLASVGEDQTISVSNPEDGAVLCQFVTGHTGEIRDLAFSPDGRSLASASQDKTIKLWDAKTSEELHTLRGHARPVVSVAFTLDGHRVASGSFGEIKMWDAITGADVYTLQGHTGWITSVVFSPDGCRLASSSLDETIKVWDANTGAELHTLQGHSGHVYSVAFSPDGRRLASCSGDETIKIWDPENGVELHTLMLNARCHTVAFSPDGRWLVAERHRDSYSDNHGAIVLWDTGLPAEDAKMAQFIARQLYSSLMDPDLVAAEIASHSDWPDAMRQAGLDYLRRVPWPCVEAQLCLEKAIVAIERSDWQDAARQLNRRVELADRDERPDLLGSLALVELLNGNSEAYREACDQLGKSDRDWQNYQKECKGVAAICCAGEVTLESRGKLLDELEQRFRAEEQRLQEKPHLLYDLMVLRKGILYREHCFEQVLSSLDDTEAKFTALSRFSSMRWMRIPDSLFLAMAHHQLGHAEEAKRWLAVGQEAHEQLLSDEKQRPVDAFCYLESVLNDDEWMCRALLSQLRKEAESLIIPTANEAPSPAMPQVGQRPPVRDLQD